MWTTSVPSICAVGSYQGYEQLGGSTAQMFGTEGAHIEHLM